ncbi:MAG: Transcription antitermination protein nusG [Chlamydiota bacterium]|jgi:transcriptional antiterminator NusG
MLKWYVVQVVSGLEKRVKKTIEENRSAQGMEGLVENVLVPVENVAEVKKGQQKVSEKKLWPGYILVKMELTDDSWMYVRGTNGVLGFLGGEKPSPLSDKEVEALLSDMEERKSGVVHKHNIVPGDRVKIVDGVFVNFIGVVQEVFHEKGRLSVLVSIFGRDTRVDDLEFWQVEQVAKDVEVS